MSNTKLIFKISIFLTGIILILFVNTMSPVIGAQTTIQQLNNDYTSHTSIGFWNLYKVMQVPVFLTLSVVLFATEITNIMSKILKKIKGNA